MVKMAHKLKVLLLYEMEKLHHLSCLKAKIWPTPRASSGKTTKQQQQLHKWHRLQEVEHSSKYASSFEGGSTQYQVSTRS